MWYTRTITYKPATKFQGKFNLHWSEIIKIMEIYLFEKENLSNFKWIYGDLINIICKQYNCKTNFEY